MDYSSYIGIISNRGDLPYRDVDGTTYALSAFREDLLSAKAVWVNHYRRDFIFSLITKHSVISMFGVPRHHPLTRCHRFLLFLSTLCLSVFTSSIMTLYIDHRIPTIIWLSMLSALFISIYNAITKRCLLCSCFESLSNRCGRCFCKSIGFVLAVYIQCFNAILYLLAAIAILDDDEQNTRHFWVIWTVSTITAYLIEALWIWIYFHYRWTVEHSLYAQGALHQKLDLNVTFDEFEHWNNGQYLNMSLSSSSMEDSQEEEEWSPRHSALEGQLKVFITPQRL